MKSKTEYFDYYSQLFAIRCLLSRQDQADQELGDKIKEADTFATRTRGAANERWVEEWVDRVHSSVYQDAAHSMATVGMLAPFIESAFKRAFRHMGKGWPGQKAIMERVVELGMKDYMPDDLGATLQAVFKYRNKMFHFGFEWPAKERKKFENKLHESCWPSDWFEKTTTDGEHWMFYMSRKFIDHCLERAEQVIEGIEKFELEQGV